MGGNLDDLTYPIICTGFPTSCDMKYDILVKKSINNHFKQPWVAMFLFQDFSRIHQRLGNNSWKLWGMRIGLWPWWQNERRNKTQNSVSWEQYVYHMQQSRFIYFFFHKFTRPALYRLFLELATISRWGLYWAGIVPDVINLLTCPCFWLWLRTESEGKSVDWWGQGRYP